MKLRLLIFCSISFQISLVFAGEVSWGGGGADTSWRDGQNWSNNLPPGKWKSGTNGLVHDATVTGQNLNWMPGSELKLTGSTHWNELNSRVIFRNGATLTIQGISQFIVSHDMYFGFKGSKGGILNISGGCVKWGRRLSFSHGSVANQSGGSLQIDRRGSLAIVGSSVYNISGGEIMLAPSTSIIIGSDGYLNFCSGAEAGVLVAGKYNEAEIRQMVDSGAIRYNGENGSGLGDVFFDAHFNYDSATSKLTIKSGIDSQITESTSDSGSNKQDLQKSGSESKSPIIVKKTETPIPSEKIIPSKPTPSLPEKSEDDVSDDHSSSSRVIIGIGGVDLILK